MIGGPRSDEGVLLRIAFVSVTGEMIRRMNEIAVHASAADWTAAIGQIAGAVFTLAAVVVALAVALRDERRRHQDRDDYARAQARLVLTGGPGSREEDGSRATIFPFTNHGDRPVLDVYAELWPSRTRLEDRPLAVHARIVLPGQDLPIKLRRTLDAPASVTAWRVRWTDADGRQWCVDQPQQPEPLPYTGQPPRRY